MLARMTAAPTGSPPRPHAGGDAPVTAGPAAGRPADESRPSGPAAPDDAPLPPDADPDTSSIRVTTEGSTVVIAVENTLDGPAGDTLYRLAAAAVEAGKPERLDVDLRALQDYTEEGAQALVACRVLASRLSEGLHYRTGRGPGREALLLAYQDADAPDEPEALGDPG
jgi:hypothetical protein